MKTQLTKALILVSIAAGFAAAGCELIVDFDRTKIPVETVETDAGDAAAIEDATVADSTTPTDAATDADAEATDAADASDQ